MRAVVEIYNTLVILIIINYHNHICKYLQFLDDLGTRSRGHREPDQAVRSGPGMCHFCCNNVICLDSPSGAARVGWGRDLRYPGICLV